MFQDIQLEKCMHKFIQFIHKCMRTWWLANVLLKKWRRDFSTIDGDLLLFSHRRANIYLSTYPFYAEVKDAMLLHLATQNGEVAPVLWAPQIFLRCAKNLIRLYLFCSLYWGSMCSVINQDCLRTKQQSRYRQRGAMTDVLMSVYRSLGDEGYGGEEGRKWKFPLKRCNGVKNKAGCLELETDAINTKVVGSNPLWASDIYSIFLTGRQIKDMS